MSHWVRLRELAIARAGDKGDLSNICVVSRDPAHWDVIRTQVTADRVRQLYGALVRGPIERYELPRLHALNFVMHGALGGGVTRSLALDPHGKTRSSLILTLEVALPGQDLGGPNLDRLRG
jgi:hypothetical protein